MKRVFLASVPRAVIVMVVVTIAARYAVDLAELIPGPAAVEALGVSIAFGVVAGLLATISTSMLEARQRPLGGDGIEARGVLMGLAASSFGFVAWLALAASGSWLVVGALIAIPLPLVRAAGLARAIERRGEPLDDEVLARRLVRFAREVGVPSLRVVVSSQDVPRSLLEPSPDVFVERDVAEVPRALLHEGSDVVEFRLARQLVRVFRNRSWYRRVRPIWVLILCALLPWIVEGQLLSFASADTIKDPAFTPTAVVAVLVAGRLSKLPWLVADRRVQASEIRAVLDLTRSPDGALRSLAVDERLDARLAGGILRWRRLSAPEQRAVIESWRAERRVCLLFTDIVGSTELVSTLGDEAWLDVLAEHDVVVRATASDFDGEENKHTGDGFLILFPDAGKAVLAASEIWHRLRSVEAEPGVPIRVRMGLHIGEVIARGDMILGQEVHLASRVGTAAGADEILVSRAVYDELVGSRRFTFGAPRSVELKGFTGAREVFPVEADTAREPALAGKR